MMRLYKHMALKPSKTCFITGEDCTHFITLDPSQDLVISQEALAEHFIRQTLNNTILSLPTTSIDFPAPPMSIFADDFNICISKQVEQSILLVIGRLENKKAALEKSLSDNKPSPKKSLLQKAKESIITTQGALRCLLSNDNTSYRQEIIRDLAETLRPCVKNTPQKEINLAYLCTQVMTQIFCPPHPQKPNAQNMTSPAKDNLIIGSFNIEISA